MWIPILIWVGISSLVDKSPPPREPPIYGVTFSTKQAQALGLDWQETYSVILEDIGVKRLRLIAYWDQIQPEADRFDFSALDWQLGEAFKNDAKVILALGMKLPRWPECHIPKWVRKNQKSNIKNQKFTEELEAALLQYVKTVVEMYKDSPVIEMWQVENEPFFQFGECPRSASWRTAALVKKEIDVVQISDNPLLKRPVLVSDSGELGTWFGAARLADKVGTTMYRRTWKKGIGYFNYILPPRFYEKKAKLIKKLFGDDVIVIEMQAEPWVPSPPITNYSIEEQFRGLNFAGFRDHIEYARASRLNPIYFWGVEWWYWLRSHGQPEFWDYVKKELWS